MTTALEDVIKLCEDHHQMAVVYMTVLQTTIVSGYPFMLDKTHKTVKARQMGQAVLGMMQILRSDHPVIEDFLQNQPTGHFNSPTPCACWREWPRRSYSLSNPLLAMGPRLALGRLPGLGVLLRLLLVGGQSAGSLGGVLAVGVAASSTSSQIGLGLLRQRRRIDVAGLGQVFERGSGFLGRNWPSGLTDGSPCCRPSSDALTTPKWSTPRALRERVIRSPGRP